LKGLPPSPGPLANRTRRAGVDAGASAGGLAAIPLSYPANELNDAPMIKIHMTKTTSNLPIIFTKID